MVSCEPLAALVRRADEHAQGVFPEGAAGEAIARGRADARDQALAGLEGAAEDRERELDGEREEAGKPRLERSLELGHVGLVAEDQGAGDVKREPAEERTPGEDPAPRPPLEVQGGNPIHLRHMRGELLVAEDMLQDLAETEVTRPS